MRRLLPFTFTIVLAMLSVSRALAEIVVVVNPANPVSTMTRNEVVDIYMGRRSVFPNGRAALPVDLPGTSPVREGYYQGLVKKTVSQVNAYWARLLFTGRATPPRVLTDAAEVLDVVGENLDAVGYLDSADANESVKVVYRLE